MTPFRLRINNYKASSRKFNRGGSVPQADLFSHFREQGHSGFEQDVVFRIIDRVDEARHRESYWQWRLDCFKPKGMNSREVYE